MPSCFGAQLHKECCKYKSARNDVGAYDFHSVDADAISEPQAHTEQVQQQHASRKITSSLPVYLDQLRHERQRRAGGGHRADHRGESVNLHIFLRMCCQCDAETMILSNEDCYALR